MAKASGVKNYDGDWTIHSAFNDQPRKIIATPEEIFFLCHPHYYNNRANAPYYANFCGGAFVYRNNAPAHGMVDIHRLYNLSGADIYLMAYAPYANKMVITYGDGGIDILDLSGSGKGNVKYVSALRDNVYPGQKRINTITPDLNSSEVWIATDSGFLRIDLESGTVKNDAHWLKDVNSVCRVGNNVVASTADGLYMADAESNLSDFDSFTPVTTITQAQPECLMPVSDRHFSFISSNNICLATFDGNAWKGETLRADNELPETGVFVASSRLEHTVMPNRDGVLISSKSYSYLMKYPTSAQAQPELVRYTHESTRYTGSWDNETFWFYRPYGKFHAMKNTGTPTAPVWNAVVEPLRPAAPLTAQQTAFQYSPKYGFMAMGQGWDVRQGFYMDPVNPMLLATLKDGVWTNRSPRYFPPKAVTELTPGTGAYNAYNASINKFPIADPTSFFMDPCNPDWLLATSYFQGLCCMDLSDMSKYPILSLCPNNDLTNVGPCIKNEYPQQSQAMPDTYLGGVDSDGVFWQLYGGKNDTSSPYRKYLKLWYWTPEDRKAAFESNDPSQAKPWHQLKPYPTFNDMLVLYMKCHPLKHPKNKNKIIMSNVYGSHAIYIFDHNGTLEDETDDKWTVIKEYTLPGGSPATYSWIYDIYEDPLTGNIIMTSADSYIVDIDSVDEQGVALAYPLAVDGSNAPALFPTVGYDVCFDEYNRMWVAASDYGVVCFSADRKKIIASYTRDNSPLPNGKVYSLGWNPDTKSLFIAADCALFEVHPTLDGIEDKAADPQATFVMPAMVKPDYTGTVAILNAPSDARYLVRDTENRVVSEIPAVKDHATYWNLLDKDQRRVPSGRYLIYQVGSTEAPLEVLVTR